MKVGRKRRVCQKRPPKNKFVKNPWKYKYFEHSLWALFAVHLGRSIFLCAQLGCSDGAPRSFTNILKQLVSAVFGDPSWATNLDHVEKKTYSHAAWRLFCIFGRRSHAAWRSFCVLWECSHAARRSSFLTKSRSHAVRRSFSKVDPGEVHY